ncbi:MAG: Lrp/AsnC family transcriptional regulator [Gemmatimonadota bacterium]|nr:MAG: Lrp/AsnC family transcriptional regulator [Gemmatimonadota bacterium]
MPTDLDPTDRHILALLQAAGRTSYQELGDAVGLSGPAAYQRVRKLEAAGVITGYHARVAPEGIGHAVVAFIWVRPGQGTDVRRLIAGWTASSEVLECHRVTGPDGYLLKLRVGSVSELDAYLEAVRKAGCLAEAHVGLRTVFERWILPAE